MYSGEWLLTSRWQSKLTNVLHLEKNLTYRFPVIEILAGLVAFTSGLGFTYSAFRTIGMNILPGSSPTGAERVDFYLQYAQQLAAASYGTSLLFSCGMLSILIPMLASYIVARPFEDGSFRTILSYPISRGWLFIVRLVLLVVIPGSLTVCLSLLLVNLLLPVGVSIGHLIVMICSAFISLLFVSASSFLLSIVSKRSMISSAVGVLFWTSFVISGSIPELSTPGIDVVFPIRAVVSSLSLAESEFYLGSITLLGLSLVCTMVAVISGLVLFERAEVS